MAAIYDDPDLLPLSDSDPETEPAAPSAGSEAAPRAIIIPGMDSDDEVDGNVRCYTPDRMMNAAHIYSLDGLNVKPRDKLDPTVKRLFVENKENPAVRDMLYGIRLDRGSRRHPKTAAAVQELLRKFCAEVVDGNKPRRFVVRTKTTAQEYHRMQSDLLGTDEKGKRKLPKMPAVSNCRSDIVNGGLHGLIPIERRVLDCEERQWVELREQRTTLAGDVERIRRRYSRDELWGILRAEHTEVGHDCFGSSHTEFTAGNVYKVTTCPADEYTFAADPNSRDLRAYGDNADVAIQDIVNESLRREGLPEGHRKRTDPIELAADIGTLTARLNKSLRNELRANRHPISRKLSFTDLTEDEVRAMNLTPADLLMLILYTSPMFEIYNRLTRAMGYEDGTIKEYDKILYDQADARRNNVRDSEGRPYFRYSLHVLNRAILKLQSGQRLPSCTLQRGITDRPLPDDVLEPGDGNRRLVDCCPISASLERRIAIDTYALADWKAEFAMVLKFTTNGVVRGASLGFISQYFWEKELVLPAFTQLYITSEDKLDCYRLECYKEPEPEQTRGQKRMHNVLRLNCSLVTADLARENAELRAQIEQRDARIAELERRLPTRRRSF